MTDQRIESIMRDFLKALTAKDIDKVLSYYTEDGDWTTSEGVFKGKTELRRYLKWIYLWLSHQALTWCSHGFKVTQVQLR